MTVWLVVTEGDRNPTQVITACSTAKHAKITAKGYSRYMPHDEDIAMVVPTAAAGGGITVYDHAPNVTNYISTHVLERTLAQEHARQGETLLIEHIEDVLHDRKTVQQ